MKRSKASVAGLAVGAFLSWASGVAAQEASTEARPLILFNACDYTTTVWNWGCELWATDLTEAGTRLVRDINAGPNSSGIERIVPLGNGLGVFSADDGSSGRELWVSDGTRRGTRMIADIFPGMTGSAPAWITPLGNGQALFAAESAYDVPYGMDRELWITDGTPAGTQRVRDVMPGPLGSNPAYLVPMGDGRVMFAATSDCVDGNFCHDLWVSDGTEAGTRAVRAYGTQRFNAIPQNLFPLGNGRVLFSGYESLELGRELWISDGTRRGTRLVQDIWRGGGHSAPEGFALLTPGRAVFTAETLAAGREVWATDGTRAGTSRVRDIRPGAASSNPRHLTTLAPGLVILAAETDAAGREPWITDGTRAGTRILRNIRDGAASGLLWTAIDPFFTPLGDGRAVFRADNGADGTELWVTDGTRRGTRMVIAINPGAAAGDPIDITAIGDGRAVFSGSTGYPLRTEPFVTNGRARNTRMIADVNPCVNCSSTPSAFARIR